MNRVSQVAERVRNDMGAVLALAADEEDGSEAWQLLHNAHNTLGIAHSLIYRAQYSSAKDEQLEALEQDLDLTAARVEELETANREEAAV